MNISELFSNYMTIVTNFYMDHFEVCRLLEGLICCGIGWFLRQLYCEIVAEWKKMKHKTKREA